MWNTIFLLVQGGLMGLVAGWVFPDWDWPFFAIIVANAILVVAYGKTKADER